LHNSDVLWPKYFYETHSQSFNYPINRTLDIWSNSCRITGDVNYCVRSQWFMKIQSSDWPEWHCSLWYRKLNLLCIISYAHMFPHLSEHRTSFQAFCWYAIFCSSHTHRYYSPSIVTVLIRFIVRDSGRSALLMMTATCPSPPPGTHATHSRPNLMFFSSGRIMASPKASWKQRTDVKYFTSLLFVLHYPIYELYMILINMLLITSAVHKMY